MVTRRRVARKKRSTTGYSRLSGVSTLGAAPARRGGAWVVLVLGALVVVNLYVFVWNKKTSVAAIKREAAAAGPETTDRSGMPAAALPSQPLVEAGADGEVAQASPVGPPGTIEGKVVKGDTLGRLLKRSGLTAPETDEVIRSLSGVLDFKTIRPGQEFRIDRGADGRVSRFELVLGKVHAVSTERAATGDLVGTARAAETRVELEAVAGRIDSSLYASLKAAGESAALVDFFVDVFAYDLDFYNDTHEGDTFRVLVEKEFKGKGADKTLVRYRKIMAAEYMGKAGTFRTFWHGGRYYDATGASSEKSLLKTPLKFTRVSSGFDRKRMHPVMHRVSAHLGIDYAAPTGTPVWAAAAGTITHRGPAGGAGNLVMIRHDSGIETAYMHLSKFAGIKVGQRVPAKTVIGYVGTTGLSTGPHLHFGVKKNGAYIDPTTLAPIRAKGLAGRDLAAFKAEVGKLELLLQAILVAPSAT